MSIVYLAMVASLDESVRQLITTLKRKRLYDNTVIIFTTDNGAAAGGLDMSAGSNFPLRGVKNTLWEGGVRGVAFVHSPLIKRGGRVYDGLMHVADWLPTIYGLANGNIKGLGQIDGFDLWDVISKGGESPRYEVLHGIDPLLGNRASLRVGDYKIIMNQSLKFYGDWYKRPVSAHELDYVKKPRLVRNATVTCNNKLPHPLLHTHAPLCDPLKKPCLFNIKWDPCEYHNLAEFMPNTLKVMLDRLKFYKRALKDPLYPQLDNRANPDNTGGVWIPWRDNPLIDPTQNDFIYPFSYEDQATNSTSGLLLNKNLRKFMSDQSLVYRNETGGPGEGPAKMTRPVVIVRISPETPETKPTTPYVPPTTPYVPPTTPYVPPTTPYVPPTTPYVPPTQAPVTTPYVAPPTTQPTTPYVPPSTTPKPYVPIYTTTTKPYVPPQVPYAPPVQQTTMPYVETTTPSAAPPAAFADTTVPYAAPQTPPTTPPIVQTTTPYVAPSTQPTTPYVPPTQPTTQPTVPYIPPLNPATQDNVTIKVSFGDNENKNLLSPMVPQPVNVPTPKSQPSLWDHINSFRPDNSTNQISTSQVQEVSNVNPPSVQAPVHPVHRVRPYRNLTKVVPQFSGVPEVLDIIDETGKGKLDAGSGQASIPQIFDIIDEMHKTKLPHEKKPSHFTLKHKGTTATSKPLSISDVGSGMGIGLNGLPQGISVFGAMGDKKLKTHEKKNRQEVVMVPQPLDDHNLHTFFGNITIGGRTYYVVGSESDELARIKTKVDGDKIVVHMPKAIPTPQVTQKSHISEMQDTIVIEDQKTKAADTKSLAAHNITSYPTNGQNGTKCEKVVQLDTSDNAVVVSSVVIVVIASAMVVGVAVVAMVAVVARHCQNSRN